MSSINFTDPEMQEIFDGFLVETNELLESLSPDLMELESNPTDSDLINRIFRSFHTVKGTSSFMGFNTIAEITHHAEDILNKLRRGELQVSQPIIDVLLEVHDKITLLVENLQSGVEAKVDYSNTIERINLLKAGLPIVEATHENTTNSKQEIGPAEAVPLHKSNEIDSLGFVDAVLNNDDMISRPGDFTDDELSLLEAAFAEVNSGLMKEYHSKVGDLDEHADDTSTIDSVIQDDAIDNKQTNADKKDIIINEQVAESKLEAGRSTKNINPGKPKAADTIRIDVNRVETLMDLSGELVLGRNRLAQLAQTMEQSLLESSGDVSSIIDRIRELTETTAQIDFVTSEIQSAVMKMRMVPIGKLYQKAPRIVRDLSKEFSKKINLVVKGEDTEIDRGIIEELNDPLVHMIRNSCDHGIESSEIRASLGKPEFGTITLDAEQEGNNIVIKISDDGAGMDPDKLKAKALEKGLITLEQSAAMTAREAYQLIFYPGFSTAVKVSAVSGRGVGMDVVRTNIQNLKGIIDIESEIGKGSMFIIKLPLTLAIIQGLLVKVKNETYALPLSSVVEVVAISMESIYSVNQQEVIRIRKEVIPIIRLDKALNMENPTETLENKYVVNVGLGIQRVGLVVDELLGQQEIVIKSLGEYLGAITGIAGSTIMGDGRVIMIIDVTDLLQAIYKNEYGIRK